MIDYWKLSLIANNHIWVSGNWYVYTSVPYLWANCRLWDTLLDYLFV